MMKLPFETFNQNRYEREMRRSLRAMRGWSDFELTIQIGREEAAFLADWGKLDKEEDRLNEDLLAASLKGLLQMAMELRKSEANE